MRIVIDLQGAQTESRFRGIGRYSLSISKAIAENRGLHEIIIVLSNLFPDTIEDIKEEFKNILPKENIKIWDAIGAVKESDNRNAERREISEILKEAFFINLKPDIVLITSLFEGYADNAVTSVKKFDTINTAVVLYDLIPYIHKEQYLENNELYKNYYINKINYLKKADLLLGISQSSCNEAVKYLNYNDTSLVNISSAVDDSFTPHNISIKEKQQFVKKYGITKKTILYAPGGFDIRKNFENLIKAYAMLANKIRNEYQLLIVSRIDDENKQRLLELAKDAGIKKNNLLLTGYVTDEELRIFYTICDLFVFPSIHEGFGLPVLEAMKCGAAVIGSNITSIPEVIGLEEALFDPYSIDSIKNKIQEVLENEVLKQKLLEHNKQQVKVFSWNKSAKIVIDAVEKLATKDQLTQKFDDMIQQISDIICKNKITNNKMLYDISQSIYNNRIESRMKTMWIDVSIIKNQDFATGIQRVVRSIIEQFFKLDTFDYDIKLIYLEHGSHLNKDYGWVYRFASDYQSKVTSTTVFEENYIVEPKKGDIFFGLDLVADIVNAQKEKLFSNWKSKGVEINFVIYDILPILHPYWWPEGGSNKHTKWLKTILNVSDKLLCISKAVADETKMWAQKNNIEVSKTLQYEYFHLGADIDNSKPSKGIPDDAKKVLQTVKNKTTFLMVGTLEPRKGHLQTLKAFTALWSKGVDVNLVIIGKNGWMVEELITTIQNHKELNKKLFWLNGISDEYLNKVYQHSDSLLASSEGEGFGLPLIEAAQFKMPIIARDIPVFKEVAGEFAYYFKNDNSADNLAKDIQQWIKLFENNTHPKSDSMPWLTWQESAKSLLNLLLIDK